MNPSRRRFIGILAATFAAPLVHAQTRAPSSSLVVVFSRRGNTLALARMIAASTGADVFVLRPANPYPKDYRANVEQVAREKRERFSAAFGAAA